MKDIIEKLTGNRVAVGSTEYDREVLANLEIVKDVLYPIILDLITNVERINEPQASVQKIAEESFKILKTIQQDIETSFDYIEK